jgi:hypothetical protein
MMDNLVRHLRILWRADSIIADIYLRLLVPAPACRSP